MMQRFHELAQNYPETRGATERIRDSDEIYREFASLKAAEQSSRCLQCGVPFCQVHCPLHNNIPDWLKLVAEGRLKEAYEVSSATNNFPEICGRICPQDKLCEGNCVVNKDFGAITIGAVEKYITEVAWKEGWITGFAPVHEQPLSRLRLLAPDRPVLPLRRHSGARVFRCIFMIAMTARAGC